MRRFSLATVLAAALIVAGCSSNEAPSEESSTTTPAPNGHGAYAECLQQHGVSAPPGPIAGPPPGTDEAAWHKAMQACSSLAPGPDAG
ncbi:hypothetical protein DVS77_09460 [Mycolicibacterium moriokaense]|nr:hypothetical protein DVS77_09460 [Mycolicibacterium moriokaense]